MKHIAVTQRTYIDPNHGETRDCIDQRWYTFLNACNYTITLIPNHWELAECILSNNQFDGYLLTGGNETAIRTKIENKLIDNTLKYGIPLLGVCHGMQRIQQYFGTSLTNVLGHVTEKMIIQYGDQSLEVNSFHDYGSKQETPNFNITGRSSDGIVKSFKHCSAPIQGIMWHPERYDMIRDFDKALFEKIYR